MNKFIGIICTWGNEDWIELAINQALSFCDEVIVSVGPHCTQVIKYEDRTLEICKRFGSRIKLVPVIYTGSHNTTKAATMNAMLKSSEYFEVNNCVILLDVDEFYHPADIKEIKDKLANGYNSAIITSKIFFINMNKYIIGDHYRVWKITSEDCGFRPTNRWTGRMEPIYQTDHPIMFHYTFLLNPYAKMDFWKGEYSGTQQNEKVLWMKDIYLKYDLHNEDYWLNENLRLFGNRRPSGPHDFGYPNEHLLDLNDKHPDSIENSKLRNIEDFRKIYTEM